MIIVNWRVYEFTVVIQNTDSKLMLWVQFFSTSFMLILVWRLGLEGLVWKNVEYSHMFPFFPNIDISELTFVIN